MSGYNIVVSTDQSTVVAEYSPEYSAATEYQSEADLEREFITQLSAQGYEPLNIKDEAALKENLRRQLEMLNDFNFSDAEWQRFFDVCIANANEGVIEKTRKIQDDHIQILKLDNGATKNVYLIDKKNIHNNYLQIINQYEEADGTRKARYDVTILVNGLPLVHIELKRRGVAIREAFNQIRRYQRDSFWAASGLYEYAQIFVISNGANTKYYSNTTRDARIKEALSGERRKGKKTSNSFEFTNYWADANNKTIFDLVDFTKTFFSKHTLLSILARYCVFTSEDLLLVMRPYQIAATEQILRRIVMSSNYKKTGTVSAGGYIWHTTGSGKTLTSFKTAQLVSKLDSPEIYKVLFVVDRKDLDYQTMKEYDRFEKGAANSNTSTKILQSQLENPNSRIIITTIQKLDVFISKNKTHEVYKKHIVIIFDECHRSQFGDMHAKIVKAFRNYHIFGFTGTPIFSQNANKTGNPHLKTTEQAFGDKLHTYTIVDAINDDNVLPFRVDFINTVGQSESIADKEVRAIDIEKALSSPRRINAVVKYILDHFDQKTKRSAFFDCRVVANVKELAQSKHNTAIEKKEFARVSGFNSIFAVSSIQMAKKYYEEFRIQLAETNRNLIVATIFSYSANEDDPADALADEDFENDRLDKTSRDFLESAIADYNRAFNVNYNTSPDKFQNYYKDVSLRVKNREIDLLIVVNMFLTGFDATTLNTLWVDKNLKHHGLIQAFSRTNRILNSVKVFGNIICFRDLKQALDDAVAVFGDKDASGIVLLKAYNDYYNGYDQNGKPQRGYVELIAELTASFPIGKDIVGEEAKKDFIRLYGTILRLKNILAAFDDFAGNEILSERSFQDYQSLYIDHYQSIRKDQGADKENINDDLVFELELIKQIEVNIDYILMLVEKYHASNFADKDALAAINRAVDSSISLCSKKDLIERFIKQINVFTTVEDEWRSFIEACKEQDLSALIAEEKLKDEKARKFIDRLFSSGVFKTSGADIDEMLPPMSRFSGGRSNVKQRVIDKLFMYFEKYCGLTHTPLS
jgi:type I restriction enzyme R subunit